MYVSIPVNLVKHTQHNIQKGKSKQVLLIASITSLSHIKLIDKK